MHDKNLNEKINKAVQLIKSSDKIVIFTGAGISTNCGIPDFRGENGIYNMVKKKYNLPYSEAVFDISYFEHDPHPFYDLTKELFKSDIQPSLSHKFIAWLEEKGKTINVVTQNIDMLHTKAGSKNVIECHGTYLTAHCLKCGKKFEINSFEDKLKKGEIPLCICSGIIKPDVVFFGEMLPDKFYIAYHNPPEADLVIVMGSSLMVQPAAGFALMLANKINSMIINNEPTVYDKIFDLVVNMDIDEFSSAVWEKLKKNNKF